MTPATHLADNQAPNVDELLDRAAEEARRHDEADSARKEPLPYCP